ncbi:hypothetical protein NEMIN01_1385 [Nematocida minor]|uniref:uncharacterized protein n=1 Tax=Nematocida minor TaxID=1912983 RepID=UPI00222080A5|nr:uncharacterized protein NEMIN01_1385 [Nematocida minor]KAI5191116.1 hypothetical protein NEMIN01_1385 [Nematocida minor]
MENTLQDVFDVFADHTVPNSIRRENVLPMLQALGYIVLSEDVDNALPLGKDLFTFSEIQEILSNDAFSSISKEDVAKAFEVFDSKKTGKMSVSALKSILQTGPYRLDQEEIDACLDILNPSPEGVIEYIKNTSLSSL